MSIQILIGWILALFVTPGMLIMAGGGSEIGNRDKTGTNGVPRNTAGSQTLVEQALTSLVLFKAEGKGLEPSTPCGATDFESCINICLGFG